MKNETYEPAYRVKVAIFVRYIFFIGFGLAIFFWWSWLYVLPFCLVGFAFSFISLLGVKIPYKYINWKTLEFTTEGEIIVKTNKEDVIFSKKMVSSTSLFYSTLDKKIGSATLCLHLNDGSKFCIPGLKGVDKLLANYYQ